MLRLCKYFARPLYSRALLKPVCIEVFPMKVLSSLKSAKSRHRDCKIVRRRGKK